MTFFSEILTGRILLIKTRQTNRAKTKPMVAKSAPRGEFWPVALLLALIRTVRPVVPIALTIGFLVPIISSVVAESITTRWGIL